MAAVQMTRLDSKELAKPKKPEWRLKLLAVTGAVAALSLLLAGQLAVIGTGSLLSRHFWLDEMYTYRLVADPDVGHAMRALASGVETHPPTFYLLARAFTRWPGANEVTLRLFSILAVLIALAGIYVWLRLSFPWEVAAATVLLIWSHDSLLTQSFNARSYTLWLAATVWFAYLLWRSRSDLSIPAWLLLALMAALLATVHWFGIISLVLITAMELWDRARRGLPLRSGMGAVLVGIVAYVCCLPFVILQRSAISVPTWMRETHWRTLIGFFYEIYHLLVMVSLSLVVLAAAGLRATRLRWLAGREFRTANRASQISLLGLLAMPVLLVGFSYLGQNVLLDRYTFPTIAALAPLAALLFARLSRPWLFICMIVLAVISSLEIKAIASNWDKWDREIDQLAVTIIRNTGREEVLFESPAQLYPLCRYAKPLAARCRLLDFDVGQIGRVTNDRLFMRDLARIYARFYPTPSLVKWDQAERMSQFFLVPHDFAGTAAATQSSNPYPGFEVQPIARRLVLLVSDRNTGKSPAKDGK
jgi:uncharacterized membrane protein